MVNYTMTFQTKVSDYLNWPVFPGTVHTRSGENTVEERQREQRKKLKMSQATQI